MQTSQDAGKFQHTSTLNAGSLAIRAFFAHLVLLFLFFIVALSGQRGGETFLDNLWLALPVLLAGVAGVFTGTLALYALFRQRERTRTNIALAIYGLLVVFVIVQVAFVP